MKDAQNRTNEAQLPEDDQRLTAYALGELTPAERVEVESMLEGDEAARAHVEALQGLGRTLENTLASAPEVAPLSATQRAAILAAAGAEQANFGGAPSTSGAAPRGRLLSSPWFSGLSAAAALVLGFLYFQDVVLPTEEGRLSEASRMEHAVRS
ncbi:MAG: anti-sigma factor RsiW, partial [Planctomycetota bacterium]